MARNQDLDRKILFLVNSGVAQVDHSGNTLLSHLLGTSSLLMKWGVRPAVCDAGLFHSVYGTESFNLSVISLEFRKSVQALIGVEAETLAYLFGIKRGETFFDQAIEEAKLTRNPREPVGQFAGGERLFRLQHRLTGEYIPIDRKQMLDLVNITIANALEQAPRVPHLYQGDIHELFRRLRPLALSEAQQAIDNFLGIGDGKRDD